MKIVRTWTVRMLELDPGWYIHTVTLSGLSTCTVTFKGGCNRQIYLGSMYTNKIILLTQLSTAIRIHNDRVPYYSLALTVLKIDIYIYCLALIFNLLSKMAVANMSFG